MEELFVSVKGYKGLYEISNIGRVKSLAKTWYVGVGKKRTKPETILKPVLNKNGYLTVVLCDNRKRKTCLVHHLVFDHYCDEQREGREKQVDHRDANKINNYYKNLQIITQRRNVSKGFQQSGRELPTGATLHKQTNKYMSRIRINGENKHLGLFKTAEEASVVYQKALQNIERRVA
ncbi:unnamed protein product [marine sediment metagenome]|uniref:NUMOD4 domain-containing protein n=1 Tax=marine sediment metagenome TaxID=412755 RepID=X0S594_9ZZZZ